MEDLDIAKQLIDLANEYEAQGDLTSAEQLRKNAETLLGKGREPASSPAVDESASGNPIEALGEKIDALRMFNPQKKEDTMKQTDINAIRTNIEGMNKAELRGDTEEASRLDARIKALRKITGR